MKKGALIFAPLNPLVEKSSTKKLEIWESSCHQALLRPELFAIPLRPGRDLVILKPTLHPPKAGFSVPEGRARTIHDLANIELQAMELAFRSLIEYPEAPPGFRSQLCELALSEGRHFRLCLDTLREMKFDWGDWPGHLCLWEAASTEDSLLERIVLVHRFLEGSGLDAGATLVRRLHGVEDPLVFGAVKLITDEELDHVRFGSRWFQEICRERRLDADEEFRRCVRHLIHQLPKRVEPLNIDLRRKALFSEGELQTCQNLRQYFLTAKDHRRIDLI